MEVIADADVASVAALMGDRARCAMLTVRSSGRHRYYGLTGPLVAAAIEALSLISPPVEARSLRQSAAATAMAEARSCYDHLAGRAGIALRDTLLASGLLSADGTRDFELTDRGIRFLEELGLDPDPILRSRRMLARDCLDWTERKPHLAGALPAALLGWLDRRRNDRGLTITNLGHANLPALGQPSTTPGLLVRASR